MKGIIFNLFEEMVTREHGERAWDDLLCTAQVEGGYSSLGNYPDHELLELAHARSNQLERSDLEVMRAFGHYALLGLAQRFPQFFAPHRHTRDFLLTLNDVIHAEVRKLHADATPPEFEFDASRPDSLVIGYRSERRLCGFAEGMIGGAATHFGETVRIVHERCMSSGADTCLLHCTFQETRDEPSPER